MTLIFRSCIILSPPKCISVVNTARNGAYGEDTIMVKQKNDSFLMFSSVWVDNKGPQRVLGFALPALTRLLRYKGLVLFVDATFDGAPKGFYQSLILSVMDDVTNMCTLIFFCPMTTKSKQAYNITWMNIPSRIGEFQVA